MKKKWGRRILAVGTAVSLLMALSGCVSETQPNENDGGETGTSATGGTYYDTAEYTEEQLTAVREGLQNSNHMEGLGEVSKMEFYENLSLIHIWRWAPTFCQEKRGPPPLRIWRWCLIAFRV